MERAEGPGHESGLQPCDLTSGFPGALPQARYVRAPLALQERNSPSFASRPSTTIAHAFRRTLIGLLLAVIARPASATEIWVAPNGDDANPGTRDLPLRTPARALRQARELRRTATAPLQAEVRVILRDGTYALNEELLIRPEDSGTQASPTVIAAADGERPVLSGGVAIHDWKLADNAVSGLPASARGHVWMAKVPRFNGRAIEFRQLWVGEQKAVRARTPNGDEMVPLRGWDRKARVAEIPTELVPPARLDGVELVLLQQWEIAVLRVQSWSRDGANARLSFAEPESRIEFEHPWPQPVFPPQFRTSPFFLTNAIEFLDAPGEWFEDVRAGVVYYWPRDGENLSTDRVIAPALESLVEIAGTTDRPVEWVTFDGISFAHSTWLRPSLLGHVPLQAGLYLRDAYSLKPKGTPDWGGLDNQAWLGRPPAAATARGAKHLDFRRCRFEHTAGNGLDLALAVQDSVVEGCLFRDHGINGLMVGTLAEGGVEAHLPYNPRDERDVCARLRLANNFLTDCANEDWGGVALIAGFVRDITIEHNEIADTSYTGISLGWGWTRTPNAAGHNTVRANLIRHAATRMSDTAGIYTLSAQAGTLITENVVEQITMSPWVHDPEHWFYLYTDEGSSFITVRDNWCPAERFLRNANGPGMVWENNGPQVSPAIREAAGLQPAYRKIRDDAAREQIDP